MRVVAGVLGSIKFPVDDTTCEKNRTFVLNRDNDKKCRTVPSSHTFVMVITAPLKKRVTVTLMEMSNCDSAKNF